MALCIFCITILVILNRLAPVFVPMRYDESHNVVNKQSVHYNRDAEEITVAIR